MDWLDLPSIEASSSVCVIPLPKASKDKNPLEEAIKAVKDITSRYPAPYTLMLSGGVDSQAMLYAWYISGVKFETLSVSYNGYNDHDICSLEKFIKVNGLDITITRKNLDILEFLENQLPKYSAKYRCSSPHICTYIRLAEMVGVGTPVFSGNFVARPEKNGASISYAILGIQRYAELEGIPLVPFFFMHTPELAYSFIKYDDRSDLDGYNAKANSYRSAGFPVIRQEEKFTGFEKLKEYYDTQTHRVSARTKLEFSSKPSKRIFDNLFRHPYEKQTNDPKLEFIYEFLKQDPQ